MQNDEEILQSAIADGLIGAPLAAIISGSGKNSFLGALAGAAIVASIKAQEQAKATNLPRVIEENGILYELSADNTKKPIKNLPKRTKLLSKSFTLK